MRQNLTFDYVKKIGYDEFGQRTYIQYGNDVRTTYTYDPERRWLSTVVTRQDGNDADSLFQNMRYEFDGVGNVEVYANAAYGYTNEQRYTYDDLYQLKTVTASAIDHPTSPRYQAQYAQTFDYDSIGNMIKKESSSSVSVPTREVKDLNYSFVSAYDKPSYAHRVKNSGDMYYQYDENGNITREHVGPIPEGGSGDVYTMERYENAYGTNYGFGIVDPQQPDTPIASQRTFSWNERNLLKASKDARFSVQYRYGADGQRAIKSSSRSENLYYNSMWQVRNIFDGSMRQSKHIYVGEVRIVTKCNKRGEDNLSYESVNTYYYHADHLGSVQLVTNHLGEIHERIEYTPYGETWIERKEGLVTPLRFTGKELDEETGLYYYGARYLDPKYSRWLSADPALGDYIPGAPVNDEAKKRNGNLPGMGGVFNTVNLE